MMIQIAPLPSGAFGFYAATAYTLTYPQTWSFPTVASTPANWPGPVVLVRLRMNGALRNQAQGSGVSVTTLTAGTISGQLAGDSLFLWVNQRGVSGGGSIAVGTMPAGWSVLHNSGAGSVVWWRPNAPAGTSAVVSSLGAADVLLWHLWASITKPSTAILVSTYKDAQAAATVLSGGALTTSGDEASLFACFSQFRQQATVFTPPTFNTPTGGYSLVLQNKLAGGTNPPTVGLSTCFLSRSNVVAGTYTPGITSTSSFGWDSIHVAVR